MAEPKKLVSETKPTKPLAAEVKVDAVLMFEELGVPMERLKIIADVLGERKRQIEKGYDAAHDDSHSQSTMVHAAYERFRMLGTYPPDAARRKALVQMAAMVVAEIERHDRMLGSGETVAL